MADTMNLQYIVVGAAVVASVVYVFVTRCPTAARRLRGWVAIRLIDSGSVRLSKLGRRIAPAPKAQDGCGSCGGCDPNG
ncbi:DUF6587 family protein [Cognatilysobacter lacus]|uniref:Uncharacterized protein n=1 Tax=Cognatilysobacter lacus TaxID=1643323 RepID=A0A5D8YZT7_9GAMM|nr:DUF6587 family protein [Lysobacter lacus]TZF87766.1 hypothetical protein FW784_10725 [Lysobacter lacus]